MVDYNGITRAADLCLGAATDLPILSVAGEPQRVLITRDGDFGAFVFLQDMGPGVICLRTLPATQPSVELELARVLDSHDESQLREALVVVEAGRHRIGGPAR